MTKDARPRTFREHAARAQTLLTINAERAQQPRHEPQYEPQLPASGPRSWGLRTGTTVHGLTRSKLPPCAQPGPAPDAAKLPARRCTRFSLQPPSRESESVSDASTAEHASGPPDALWRLQPTSSTTSTSKSPLSFSRLVDFTDCASELYAPRQLFELSSGWFTGTARRSRQQETFPSHEIRCNHINSYSNHSEIAGNVRHATI